MKFFFLFFSFCSIFGNISEKKIGVKVFIGFDCPFCIKTLEILEKYYISKKIQLEVYFYFKNECEKKLTQSLMNIIQDKFFIKNVIFILKNKKNLPKFKNADCKIEDNKKNFKKYKIDVIPFCVINEKIRLQGQEQVEKYFNF